MAEQAVRSNRMLIVTLLALTALWTIMRFAPKRQPNLGGAQAGQMADYHWSLQDLDDKPVSFERFKGKTVFLNIWATWCGPCVAEMPSIAGLALAPELRGKPIEFVCVSTDTSSDKVRWFVQGRNWTMTFLRADELPSAFLTEGIPATFIIAPDGHIAASEIGSADWNTPQVIELLRSLSTDAPTQSAPAPAAKAKGG